MTRLVRLCIASALLAFHAAAQTWTLPAELDLTDGGGSLALPFDAEAACHYMEVHRAWPGASPAPLSSMSFRRGVKGANPSATSRTASILLRMGHGSRTTFGNQFSNNFTGTPTLVLPETTVALPDWSQPKSPSQMLAWDLTISFTTPFVHNAVDDVVWEIFMQNSTAPRNTGYVVERVGTVLPYATAAATVELDGCRATNRSANMAHRVTMSNFGQNHALHPMRLRLLTGNAPALQSVAVAIGLSKLGFPIPGWCEVLYTNPVAMVPLGTASLHGTDVQALQNLPYLATAIQVPIYTQAFALDPGSPGGIALSNGCRTAMPSASNTFGAFRYTYATSVSATTGLGPFSSGALVTGYN